MAPGLALATANPGLQLGLSCASKSLAQLAAIYRLFCSSCQVTFSLHLPGDSRDSFRARQSTTQPPTQVTHSTGKHSGYQSRAPLKSVLFVSPAQLILQGSQPVLAANWPGGKFLQLRCQQQLRNNYSPHRGHTWSAQVYWMVRLWH